MPEESSGTRDDLRILACPATINLWTRSYARAYRLLSNLAAGDVQVDAVVNKVHEGTRVDVPNVSVEELGHDTLGGFYLAAFLKAHRSLRIGEYDIYHHMHLGFRGANPVAIAGLHDDVPFLIGPAEAGHDVPPAEVKGVLSRQVSFDIPEPAIEATYGVLAPFKDRVLNPVREYLFARTLQEADRIVAVHSDAKATFADYTDPEKIEVVPYGVDMEKFEYRERETGPELVTVGNLIRRKGHRYLLQAMPEVLQNVPDAHLHVIGTGRVEDDLRGFTTDLGIEESVTFHGHISDEALLARLHDARVFVHPSLSEGFSHVRLEAMSTGTPVVGTDVDGAHDLTRDGTDGFVVPTRDPNALADAMLELLTDEARTREMGRNAREKIERDHDYADIGRRYLDIYRELVGEAV